MLGRQSVFAGTLTLGIARFLALGLGFMQFAYFLHAFGSNSRTDALIVAQTVPYFLSHFFNQGVAQICVPVFLHFREQEGEEEAWRFASSLITLTTAVLFSLALMLVFLAPYVVLLLAPGFTPEDRALATTLLRWMSVLIVVNGMCGPPRCLYFSYRAFTAPAVTSLFPTLCIVLGIFLLKDRLGIYSFVAGGIAGAVVQLSVLTLLLNVGERRLTFGARGWHRGLREFLGLLMPRFLMLGLTNVNAAVDRGFASSLGPACVSALGYANTLSDAPFMWFRSTFPPTIIPLFSDDAAKGDFESFRQRVGRYIGITSFMIVPIAIFLIVLATPLVQTLFQRGEFRPEGAKLMSTAVVFYSVGLIPGLVSGVFAAGFLSLKEMITPFKVSCLLVFLNLLLDYVLLRLMGLGGLALASSLVLVARLLLLGYLLQKRIGFIEIRKVLSNLLRLGVAATCMVFVVAWAASIFGVFNMGGRPFLQQAALLGWVSLLGGGTYLVMCRCLAVSEVNLLMKHLTRMVPQRLRSR